MSRVPQVAAMPKRDQEERTPGVESEGRGTVGSATMGIMDSGPLAWWGRLLAEQPKRCRWDLVSFASLAVCKPAE